MAENDIRRIKAVIHLADKTLLKGHLEDEAGVWGGRLAQANAALPDEIEFQLLDGGTTTIRLNRAKAIFFVNQFQGQPEYQELQFFKNVPEFPGLWVRLRFADNEMTEGLVHNSLNLLMAPGFFLKPPDPQSNNKMVYALKSHLVDFEVLGLKSEY